MRQTGDELSWVDQLGLRMAKRKVTITILKIVEKFIAIHKLLVIKLPHYCIFFTCVVCLCCLDFRLVLSGKECLTKTDPKTDIWLKSKFLGSVCNLITKLGRKTVTRSSQSLRFCHHWLPNKHLLHVGWNILSPLLAAQPTLQLKFGTETAISSTNLAISYLRILVPPGTTS